MDVRLAQVEAVVALHAHQPVDQEHGVEHRRVRQVLLAHEPARQQVRREVLRRADVGHAHRVVDRAVRALRREEEVV